MQHGNGCFINSKLESISGSINHEAKKDILAPNMVADISSCDNEWMLSREYKNHVYRYARYIGRNDFFPARAHRRVNGIRDFCIPY